MAKKKTLKQILIELGAYEKFKETWKKQNPERYKTSSAKILRSTKSIPYKYYGDETWDARIAGNIAWNPWDYWHNICLQVYQMSQ